MADRQELENIDDKAKPITCMQTLLAYYIFPFSHPFIEIQFGHMFLLGHGYFQGNIEKQGKPFHSMLIEIKKKLQIL